MYAATDIFFRLSLAACAFAAVGGEVGGRVARLGVEVGRLHARLVPVLGEDLGALRRVGSSSAAMRAASAFLDATVSADAWVATSVLKDPRQRMSARTVAALSSA